MAMRPVFLCLCVLLASGAASADDDTTVIFTTNAAYLALSALSSSADSLLLVAPAEASVRLSDLLALDIGLDWIYYGRANDTGAPWAGGSTVLLECGVAWSPFRTGLSGWRLCAAPGIAYATDSRLWCLVLSARTDYRWILGSGRHHLALGLGGGGRYVRTLDGYMFLPDLRLGLGWGN